MQTRSPGWFPLVGISLLLTACSGGGSSDSVPGTSGNLLVLRTTPPNNGRLFLNEPILIDFTNRIDLGSCDLNTMSFQVFDLNGNALSEGMAGSFSLATSSGDTEPGRRLVFTPRFPTNDTYDNGGFKPGRVYLVQLVGGSSGNRTTIRDASGRALQQPLSFQFQTPDGTTPPQLFSDTKIGGPRLVDFDVTPRDENGVALNKFGFDAVEVRLGFNQPLNPSSENLPVGVQRDPLLRELSQRGRIYLEYDLPGTEDIWIPASVDLEANTRDGGTLVLRPIGILPNNATIRVIVENTVEDMSGESNVADGAYNRVFGTFTTRSSFEPQYDGLLETFAMDSSYDPGAAFLEPQAIHQNGKLSASFAFAGGEDRLTYRSRQREVILDTNFTQITPDNSPPINVSGGVFEFARVEIPEGVIVRGVGTNPMVWLVTGDFIVDGTLSVSGGLGARVDTLNSANFPTSGGIGVCGGGNGGRGSPNAVDRSYPSGEAGFGPGQRPNGGGEPGRISCQASCNRGAGGGGGSMSTEGDPWYPLNRTNVNINDWPQVFGKGGQGCLNRSVDGGVPGPRVFTDSRAENDFWGSGVNVFEGIRVTGELLAPRGGSGGGGGGDRAPRCNTNDPGYISDNKGAGGGGGAGVLIVQALGKIRVGPRGEILAEGGNGGGGEPAGSNNEGGGGGAGSGGMIVLMAGQGFDFWVHGDENAPTPRSTYGESDFDFAISADGGIGTQGTYNGLEIRRKYPFGSNTWNQRPTGAFGGLGLVQLLAPPGDDQSDNTGNRLDDNIRFLYLDSQGVQQEASPARKKALLAWRGWPDGSGNRIDDNGDPIVLMAGNPPVPNPAGEGDIRPAPVMLPSPFGATSRARSRWIDLGAAVRERRDQEPAPNDPRTVVAPMGQEPWPDFGDPELGFAGTSPNASDAGYISFERTTGRISIPIVRPGNVEAFDVDSIDTSVDFEGSPAYLVSLAAGPGLGMVEDRYAHYRVEPLDSQGTPLIVEGRGVDYRILHHTDRLIWLAPDATLVAGDVAQVRILAKFFAITTDGQDGLGETRSINLQGDLAPVANTRVGFAFHTDPSQGFGPTRWPNGTNLNEEQYEFDLRNPAFLTWLEANRPSFVQWDVVFNMRFDPDAPSNNSGVSLTSELPVQSLDYVVLPYRF